MRCAISYKEAANNKTCQFNAAEVELIKFDNKHWCFFHLPMTSAENNFSVKSSWQAEQLKYFKKKIKELLLNNFNNFKFVVFPKNFTLPLNNYSKKLFFKDAEFWGETNFSNKIFCKRVVFDNAIFFGEVLFSQSSFKKRTKFIKSHFKKKSYFVNATFERGINFRGAEFEDDSSFHGAMISCKKKQDGIYFHLVKFKKKVTFRNASFGSHASFRESHFYATTNFSVSNSIKGGNIYLNGVDFFGCSFNKLNFTNRQFLEKTNFENCIFKSAPEFHGCTIHQDTLFPDKTAFKDTVSANAANAYRTLNLAMANLRARPKEGMFYILEQKSRRRAMPWFEKFVSYCYDFFANYGQSISRPLVGLIIVILLFALCYAYLADINHIYDAARWKILIESISFSFQQTIYISKVYSPAKDSFLSALLEGCSWIQNIALVQTLISYIFGILLVFAVRWKFKRE
jgi:uncharacterized protein YjbI with pentapeptide repeats